MHFGGTAWAALGFRGDIIAFELSIKEQLPHDRRAFTVAICTYYIPHILRIVLNINEGSGKMCPSWKVKPSLRHVVTIAFGIHSELSEGSGQE
jgi:hypothetical protein